MEFIVKVGCCEHCEAEMKYKKHKVKTKQSVFCSEVD